MKPEHFGACRTCRWWTHVGETRDGERVGLCRVEGGMTDGEHTCEDYHRREEE